MQEEIMEIEVRGVHYEIPEKVREKINRKLSRLNYAEDCIVNVHFIIIHEKSYKLECQVHFRWGGSHHIQMETYDVMKGMDTFFDKINKKIAKEKEKVQSHSH